MALSANAEVQRKDGEILSAPMVAADIMYKGGLMKLNAAGNLEPCSAEAGAVFAGVGYEKVDNSAGLAGAVNGRVFRKGEFLLTGSGFSLTDVGQAVYATDDATITKTFAANIQRVGVIVDYVSSTQVWVKIEPGVLGLEGAITDVATTAATSTTPFGYAQAQADAIVANVNSILAVMRKHNMIQG
jgi:hypothetical protein